MIISSNNPTGGLKYSREIFSFTGNIRAKGVNDLTEAPAHKLFSPRLTAGRAYDPCKRDTSTQ